MESKNVMKNLFTPLVSRYTSVVGIGNMLSKNSSQRILSGFKPAVLKVRIRKALRSFYKGSAEIISNQKTYRSERSTFKTQFSCKMTPTVYKYKVLRLCARMVSSSTILNILLPLIRFYSEKTMMLATFCH